jgi:hypothetical protein
MSARYADLSLPELLDLMHPIVEPDAVPLLPQTPGWWIVFGWLAGLILLLAWHWRRRWLRNRYRREAEAELDAIALTVDTEPRLAAEAIAELLKRTALSAFPRERVAALTGPEWAEFLVQTAGNDPAVADGAERLSEAAYRANADGHPLIAAARCWIRVHRV